MQNIDPVYFLTPALVVGFSVGLLLYWRLRRRLTFWTVFASLIAYAGAISLKEVVQVLTQASYSVTYGGSPIAMGLYFGLQTVVFEVGGAYVVAYVAVSRGGMGQDDAGGYGVSLAFWENGVLLGGSMIVSYVSIYAILAGGGSLATQVHDSLAKSAPALFYSPDAALPLIGLSVLERVSSLLVHFSWGLLTVLSVVTRKRFLFAAALPMGLVDFLVPFAGTLGTAQFEAVVFAVSLVNLGVALTLARSVKKSMEHEVGTKQNYEDKIPQ